MTTTRVHVQRVHKLRVRTATSRKQHICSRAEQNVGCGKFSGMTEAGFRHGILLMLIPFGTPCSVPRRQTKTLKKTPSTTLTSIFACEMCKTRAQNTHDESTRSNMFLFFCVFWDVSQVHVFLNVFDDSSNNFQTEGNKEKRKSNARRRVGGYAYRRVFHCRVCK